MKTNRLKHREESPKKGEKIIEMKRNKKTKEEIGTLCDSFGGTVCKSKDQYQKEDQIVSLYVTERLSYSFTKLAIFTLVYGFAWHFILLCICMERDMILLFTQCFVPVPCNNVYNSYITWNIIIIIIIIMIIIVRPY